MDEIELDCGVSINLRAIEQYLTYEGLLEGLPTSEMNKNMIASAVEKAAKKWGKIYLIEPTETPIEQREKYPFGNPAWIPGVTCLSYWHSSSEFKDDYDYRHLAIVWFQSEFAMPIEPAILDTIIKMDWDKLAVSDLY